MQKGEISKICLVLYFNSSAQTASIYLFIYLLICYLPICLLIYSSYIVDINSENTLFYIRIAEINKYNVITKNNHFKTKLLLQKHGVTFEPPKAFTYTVVKAQMP